MTFLERFRQVALWCAGPLVMLVFAPVDAVAQTDDTAIVAVFDIHNQGTPLSATVVRRLGDYLAGRLAMCGPYSVAPRDQLKERLAGQRVESHKECYDQSCQIELGKQLSADKSLATALLKIGSVCEVTSSLYDIRTEKTELAAAQEGGCTEDSIRKSLQTVISLLCQRSKAATPVNNVTAQEVVLPPPPAVSAGGGVPDMGQDLPPVKKEVGYLSVQGEPKGARIDIEGPAGFGQGGRLSTSLPMRPIEVPAGDYVIKVTQSEYDPETIKVHVSADETRPAQVKLIKSYGTLILSGEPEGAMTSLRCQKKFAKEFGLPGKPFAIVAPRGDCTIEVSRDGYQAFDKSFRLEGGQSESIVVKLPKLVVAPAPAAVPAQDEVAYKPFGYSLDDAELMAAEPKKEKMARDSELRQQQISKLNSLLDMPSYRKDPNRAPKVMHMLAEAIRDESFYQYMKARDQWDSARLQWEQGIRKDMPPKPVADYTKSLEYYRIILKEFPEYPRLVDVLFFIGEGAIMEGKATKNIALQKEGVAHLNRLVRIYYSTSSHIPQAHLAMGEYYFETNQLGNAQVNYEVIINKFPSSPMFNYAQYKLSCVLANMAEPDRAIEGFKKVIRAISSEKGTAASAFRNQIFGDLVVCFAELENGWDQALTYFKSVLPESEANARMRALAKLQKSPRD